jgi:hypothetical protein
VTDIDYFKFCAHSDLFSGNKFASDCIALLNQLANLSSVFQGVVSGDDRITADQFDFNQTAVDEYFRYGTLIDDKDDDDDEAEEEEEEDDVLMMCACVSVCMVCVCLYAFACVCVCVVYV